ncbi:MAG: MATE family efflux transporter [Acidimicrobiia bacterium]|nr:MATE family efflux transporter [Acidimicrobiia bacterium]
MRLRNPLDRQILRLAVPALGALVAEPLYLLADTAVVGRLGTDSLAGLAVASTILLVGYSVFIFLAYGTTAAVGRLLGAGDHRGAAHQAVQSLWLAAGIGVVLVGVGLAVAEPLVAAMGATGAVADQALIYLRISLVGVPAMLVVLAGTGYLRGLQDTRTPLVVAAVSALGNLVLEVVWIFGLGFGIGASALATVVAQSGAALTYVAVIGRAVRRHGVPLRPHARTVGRLGLVGRDLFVRTVALRIAFVATTAVIARLGPTPLAAHQIVFELWSLGAMTLDALAIAGQAMVARALGAGDADAARAIGRRILQWGGAAGVILAAVFLAGHSSLGRVFTPDAEVVAVTAVLLVVAGLAQPINGVVFALDGLLIGAGDMRWLAVAMAISAGGYLPVLALVAASGASVSWVWAGLVWFMTLRLVTLGLRWRSGRWAVVGAGA